MNLLPPDVGFGHDALKTITELKEVFNLQRQMSDVHVNEKGHHASIRSTLSNIHDICCAPFDLLIVEGIRLLYPYDPVQSEHRAEAVVDAQHIEWDEAHEISLWPNRSNERMKIYVR